MKTKNKYRTRKAEIELGRRLYSIQETYWIFYNGIRTIRYMLRAKRHRELSSQFIERIMLAVTEVNDCAICSYAHSKRALESGMNNEEIQKMLAGVMEDVPNDEVAAVMFAQHYADSRGNPGVESWRRIVEIYGISEARGILGSIRAIMIGNAYGIVWSSFVNRFRGKADPRSSLQYELSLILSSIVFVPVSFIHAVVSDLLRKPILSFYEK